MQTAEEAYIEFLRRTRVERQANALENLLDMVRVAKGCDIDERAKKRLLEEHAVLVNLGIGSVISLGLLELAESYISKFRREGIKFQMPDNLYN